MAFAPASSGLGGRYLKLDNWDSFHYSDLLENGYHMPPSDRPVTGPDVHEYRANLGYFPGYLVACRAVRRLLPRASAYTVLLVTAQLFGILFWVYLILLFNQGGVPRGRIPGYLALIAAYPSALYLVCGYSESTFMACLAGFIYWCERSARGGGARRSAPFFGMLAALHGFAMVGTRIVGIPVVAYPVVRCLARSRKVDGQLVSAAAIAAFSLSAAVLFFGFCQLRFGHWDWYFRLQTIGWGKDPNYLALFDPRSYVPRYFFEDTVTSISRTAVPFTLWMLWRDLRADTPAGRQERAALYYAAFCLFYIALAAKADTDMDSMIRYTWPVIALLVLGWARIQKERRDAGYPRPRLEPGWVVAVLVSLAIQGWSAYRFLRGKWVA